MSSSTFEQALDARLRSDPGQPLVTFYDDATGERTELSATTYANWVAKTAGVLVEDLDLAEGSTVQLDLPPHWLGPVFLGACWLVGAEAVTARGADAWVGTPDRLPTSGERLCTGLGPFAVPTPGLPPGVLDFGTLWPGQPDDFLSLRAGPGVPAYDGAAWADLLVGATPSADRVLTDLDPLGLAGVTLALGALVGGGSVVWAANPDPAGWDHRAETEQADRQVRGG